MESIRHSAFVAEPSGVPSSKYARRYHSPSQPSRSSAAFSALTCSRQVSARSCSPRASAIFANSQRIVCRNQPSQTLSPLPSSPDAIHAVVPVARAHQRQVRERRRQGCGRCARAQCSKTVPLSLRNARLEIGFVLPFGESIAFEERNRLRPARSVAGGFDEVADRIGQPQQIVGNARAHAAPGGRMPPVLDVAFDELARGAAQNLLAGNFAARRRMSAITSCSWSRNPYAPLTW